MEINNKKKKRVTFASNVKILNMYVWSFAYQNARKNDWIGVAARFQLKRVLLKEELTKSRFFSRK